MYMYQYLVNLYVYKANMKILNSNGSSWESETNWNKLASKFLIIVFIW